MSRGEVCLSAFFWLSAHTTAESGEEAHDLPKNVTPSPGLVLNGRVTVSESLPS